MYLDRVPLFSWSMVVAGTIWLLSLPVLLAVIVLMYLGQHNGVAGWNDPNGIYNRMVWAFQQPQLYAFAIPALGIIGDTVPVFARARLRNRGVWMIAIGAFGMLGFGAWAQPWLSPRVTREFLYIAVAFLVFVPLLVVAGGVADTLRRGRATLASPVLFSLTALLALLAGAAAGAVSSIHALDLLGTTWTSAQAHLVLLGTAAAGIGAIHYWSPKLFGRVLGEGLGRATAGLLLLGTATLIIPDLVAGGLDQCRAVAQYAVKGGCPPVRDGVESLNFVSLVGGAVVTLAVLVFVVNLVTSLASRSNEPVPDDPWDGQTLEWSTTSPPPLGNFPEAPVVTSAEPLLDRAEEVEA
jgi:heme/copper-type cytochrome/quinol oxidase subunit 1